MLPFVTTLKAGLIAALTTAAIATVPAAPALAWGDKEQGFVSGAATAVIINEILKYNRTARGYDGRYDAPAFVQPAPTYTQNFVQPRATSIYRTPSARAFQSYSLSERKAIQRNLRAWGYYRGGIDGSFGPGTYNAVVTYAQDEGLSRGLTDTNSAFGVYDSLLY